MTNLMQYLHELESAAVGARPEAVSVLSAKIREALAVTNEMARLVIRYQGLLDRAPMARPDAYQLRAALGELAGAIALRVAMLPTIADGAVEAAARVAVNSEPADQWRLFWLAWKQWADRLAPQVTSSGPSSDVVQRSKIGAMALRGPISREQAISIARGHARAHEARGLGPGGGPHYLSGASDPAWQPHEWVIDAVVAAAGRRPDEFPRPALTREAAIALAQRHAEGLAPATYEGEPGRAIATWVIDGLIEASR